MKLTVLGSGTVDPLSERACSGYYVETEVGALVLDLGNGVVRRAEQFGKALAGVEHLFFSHLHPDHTSDLVTYLFARKYAPPPWPEAPRVTLYGPPGFGDFLEALYGAWPSIKPKDGTVKTVEYPEGGGEVFRDGAVSLAVIPVEHGDMNAYGFRVSEGGAVLAYSGDTKLCPGVVEVARAADLFLCECSCFPRGCEPLYCREVHLSWEDVAEVCRDSNCAQVILTHLYKPVLERKPNPLDSLSEELEIPVSLAEDGREFSL